MTHIRQLVNELVRKSLFAGLFDQFPFLLLRLLFPLRAYQTIGHIGEDGIVEEKRFLLDKPDLRPPPLQLDLVDGVARGKNSATQLDRRSGLLRLGYARLLVVLILLLLFALLRLLLLLFLLLFNSLLNGILLLQGVPPLDQSNYCAFPRAGGANDRR